MGKQRPLLKHLSRRETQIMEALYALGEANVEDVRVMIEQPPSYDSVRVTLAVLESKGLVTHQKDGRKYLYRPAGSIHKAKRRAVRRLLDVFFAGSMPAAVSAMIDVTGTRLSAGELDELARLIEARRRKATSKRRGT
ncbi:MAG: BlaI/MecI/CopY family transcriptional regulator [Phycisphaerales bacterium]|nr:MAG: BlaI/MecI/CopY family transcriptional regulator [Phycisphaerales bacterium]